MATWIMILHMALPVATLAPDAGTITAQNDNELRYRGIEALFAKFEREHVVRVARRDAP